MGPKLDKHVSFNYDPRPVIATIKPQQLWVLGGADRTAPTAKTIQILKNIQRRKHTLDLAIYKAADHGIAETFTLNGVERHRYPSGYFDLIAEWIREGTLPAANDDLELRPGTK